jgi:hypothetical protein
LPIAQPPDNGDPIWATSVERGSGRGRACLRRAGCGQSIGLWTKRPALIVPIVTVFVVGDDISPVDQDAWNQVIASMYEQAYDNGVVVVGPGTTTLTELTLP